MTVTVERKWFRHALTGDRGFMVKRDGKDMMQYDRPAAEIIVPYNPSQWREDDESFPMGPMQAAEIAYLADQRYLYYIGEYAKAKRGWLALREEERLRWCKDGPPGAGVRSQLFAAIVGTLCGVVGE